VEIRLTDSKQKTMIKRAMDVVPLVFMAATANTKQRPKYVASMYRGLKVFMVINPAARKRLKA